MAENLATFRAGRALLELLRAQPALGNDVADKIATLAAELLEEAVAGGAGAGGCGGSTSECFITHDSSSCFCHRG